MSSRGSGSGFDLGSVHSEKDRREGSDDERRRVVSLARRVAAVFCLTTLIGRRGIVSDVVLVSLLCVGGDGALTRLVLILIMHRLEEDGSEKTHTSEFVRGVVNATH
jgi:hypothetical protein